MFLSPSSDGCCPSRRAPKWKEWSPRWQPDDYERLMAWRVMGVHDPVAMNRSNRSGMRASSGSKGPNLRGVSTVGYEALAHPRSELLLSKAARRGRGRTKERLLKATDRDEL